MSAVAAVDCLFIPPSHLPPQDGTEKVHQVALSILSRNFNPARRAEPIGWDPYGLLQRDKPASAVLIPDVLLEAEKSVDIPPVIHCIWLGDPIDRARPDYWKSVCDLNREYQQLGFQLIMWCNESAMDQPFCRLCEQEGIISLNVFDVFPRGELALESAVLYCMQCIPRKYAEASDLIRYSILYRFGGIYLDEDTAGVIVQKDREALGQPILMQHREVASNYYAKIMINDRNANDYYVTRPKHDFFQKVLQAAESVYQFPEKEEYIKGLHKREKSILSLSNFRGLFRTGPGQSAKIWTQLAYRTHRLFETVSEYSWKSHQIPQLTFNHLPQVLTTMLHELKDSPSTLELFPFEGLGEDKLLEVVSFMIEHFPQTCASIRTCNTHFPALLEKIQKKLPAVTNNEHLNDPEYHAPEEKCD